MAILTGDPISGVSTYFGLGSSAAPATVDDISDFLDGVEPSSDPEELDATTFRRTQRVYRAGFHTRGFSLSGKWSQDAHEFFAPLEGDSGVAYEYGPQGNTAGQVKISGICTVLSYSGPVATHDGITTFSVEIRTESKIEGTFAP